MLGSILALISVAAFAIWKTNNQGSYALTETKVTTQSGNIIVSSEDLEGFSTLNLITSIYLFHISRNVIESHWKQIELPAQMSPIGRAFFFSIDVCIPP
jgi:hypothetical protein